MCHFSDKNWPEKFTSKINLGIQKSFWVLLDNLKWVHDIKFLNSKFLIFGSILTIDKRRKLRIHFFDIDDVLSRPVVQEMIFRRMIFKEIFNTVSEVLIRHRWTWFEQRTAKWNHSDWSHWWVTWFESCCQKVWKV